MTLHCTRLPGRMIKRKRTLRLNIVVPPIAQRVMRADKDLRAATRELNRSELFLVIFLKAGASSFCTLLSLRMERIAFVTSPS